jgi:hypothetical protein
MKRTFKLTMVLMLLANLFVSAAGADYSKTIRKGWSKSSVSALKISNKFGEIKINDMGGDSVTIKVLITIDNASSSKAKELMDKISIDFDKSGGTVSATTEIEEDFRGNNSFSIDYLVNIPKDRDLDISNKYGNLILNELEAKGNFEVNYGNMTSGNMKAPVGYPVRINVSYGKADLESVNQAVMEFKYSKLIADQIDVLTLDSKYCDITLHKISNFTLDSKYDGFSIDELGKFKSVSKYTNYKIGLLNESFDMDTEYGSVRIDNVSEKFSKIRIENSYGGINIGLNDLNYKIQAECHYCDLKYPESRYKGNKIKDNQTFTIDGTVGTGGATVVINSRYGGIKLGDN